MSVPPSSCGDGRLGRPSEAEGERPSSTSPASSPAEQPASSTPAASASPSPAPPSLASAAWPSPAPPPLAKQTAHTASSRSPTTTHTSRPRAKAHSFHSLSSGYSGKTTCSKSFSIPARTSQRSGFSARPPLANKSEGALEYSPLSHADNPRPSSFILSDPTAHRQFLTCS